MLRDDIEHCDITTGRSCGKHECSGLNLIRNDRISRAVELPDTRDADDVRSGAPDLGAHAVQEVGDINDMRLLCHVFHNRGALGHSCRHHHIDRCAD